MKKWIGLGFAFALLVLPALGSATENTKASTIDEMVVTASRSKEAKKEVTASITVITQEEIQQSTARDLGELLFRIGNVWARQYPGALTPISIRGLRTDTHGNDLLGKVLVLLNGRRAGTGNLAKIRTQNIARVEILRGPASVQYGSAGMGGIVNVITKRGEEQPQAFVEAGFGSNDRQEFSLGASGKAGKFDISGAFSKAKSGDYETSDGTTFINTEIDSKESGSLNIGYNFNPNNRLGIIYNFFEGNGIGNSSGITYKDPDDYKDNENSSIDFTYDGSTHDQSFSWSTRYFNGKDKDKWVTEPNATNVYSIETDQQGAQAQLTWQGLDLLTLTSGIDWLDYDYETSGTPKKSNYENTAGFIITKLALMDRRLILNGGLRYDDYDVEIGNNEGGTQSTDNVAANFGIAFQVTEAIKLRAAWGQGFVMPGARQLAGNYTSWGTTYVGNPDLDPEESDTLEAGINMTFGPITTSATYFHTEYENFIHTTAGSAAGTTTWKNVDEGSISGWEWELAVDLGEHFNLGYMVKPHFKGTYFDTYEDDSTGENLLYIPESTLTYGLTVGIPGTITADLNFAYYGKEMVNDYSTLPSTIVEKDSSTVADLSIIYTFAKTQKIGQFSLKGEVSNLFDENIEYVLDYPNAGRTFFLGLRWDY